MQRSVEKRGVEVESKLRSKDCGLLNFNSSNQSTDSLNFVLHLMLL